MRHEALTRTLRILRALQRGPHGLTQLAQTFGVSTQTIRRDLRVLAATGFRPTKDIDEAGAIVWRLDPGACPVCDAKGRAA